MKITFPFSLLRHRSATLTLCGVIFLAFGAGALEIPSRSSPSTDRLLAHARFLASEHLAGRGVDTRGIALARDYIAREFKEYGLMPGGDNGTYLQGLDVVTGVAIRQPTKLALKNGPALTLNRDWVPLGLSGSGRMEGELVFAGYGITVEDYGYDDYAGIDVKGKIALVLRYEPRPKDGDSPFQKAPRYSRHATLRAKVDNARAHGAAGMILVDLQPPAGGNEKLISTRRSLWRSHNGLVAVQIGRRIVERWLEERGVSLPALKEKIDRSEAPASMPLSGVEVSATVTLEKSTARAENVIGVLPGRDPELKHENIVIGAHYDHLGLGRYGARDSRSEGQIHYGADDNASGTAVVLDLAARLSRARLPRTIVFVAFTGEELGLFGSRFYVAHPPFPISSTRAMINLDMVGRLKDNRVTVAGIDAATEFRSFVAEAAAKAGLDIRESSRRDGKSDHASFNGKGVPALHFFTGVHKDYHRPTDTWDKLNVEGMAKVRDLVAALAAKLAASDAPLVFVRSSSPAPPEARKEYGSYLGTIPDFGEVERGVRLAGVQEGSPAAGAGLRRGDIIIELDEIKVTSLEDLASALRAKKPGDEIDIVVLREGKQLIFRAVLRSRS